MEEKQQDQFELCKEKFFDKGSAIRVLWVLLCAAGALVATATGWAITTSLTISKIEITTLENNNDIDRLEEQISKKLDTLIARSKQ